MGLFFNTRKSAALKCGLIFFMLIFIVSVVSCASIPKKFLPYVKGLQALKLKDVDNAKASFSDGLLSKSTLIKKLCENELTKLNDEKTVENYLYKRDYQKALTLVKESLEVDPVEYLANSSAVYLSNAGKAFLYGSTDFVENANLWLLAAESKNQKKNDALFMLYFYSARMLDRAGASYRLEALNRFKRAIDISENDENYDSALYYYLSVCSKISINDFFLSLQQYDWNNAEWFDDLFEEISVKLLNNELWNEYYNIYQIINQKASERIVSQYAYVCGRLLQEGLLTVSEKEPSDFFKQVYENATASFYYTFLAAEKLNLPVDFKDIKKNIAQSGIESKEFKEFYKLLQVLIDCDLKEYVYPLWYKNRDLLSFSQSISISEKLSNFSSNPDIRRDVLRLNSLAVRKLDSNYDFGILKRMYPKYFEPYISVVSEKYNLPEYFLYALIHSESFFDENIISSAGAKGLTQLMDSTGADVAKKLKIADYDLLDPETNMLFGSYYLSELIKRSDFHSMDAFLSYNAGISRVRIWRRQKNELPTDLFMEVIPYAETRNYGRKILTAACMYGLLYFEKKSGDIVLEILK